jgi:hypothetical protein
LPFTYPAGIYICVGEQMGDDDDGGGGGGGGAWW